MEGLDLEEILLPSVFDETRESNIPTPEEYQYWSDRSNRIFYIAYEIDDDYQLVELAKTIISINVEDANLAVEDRKPIRLFIMSYGGDLDQANFFCDLIRASKTPIYTIATGAAMSAGMLILLSGHKKYAFTHSRILVHQGSASFSGTATTVNDAAKDYNRQLDRMKEYILANTTIDKKTLNRKWSQDWYLSAEECLKYGIIDEIVTDLSTIL